MNDFNDQVWRYIPTRMVNEPGIPDDVLRLFSQRADVLRYNRQRITRMEGETITLASQDVGDSRALDNEVDLSSALQIKLNAPVMLLQNLDMANGWANGMIGTV